MDPTQISYQAFFFFSPIRVFSGRFFLASVLAVFLCKLLLGSVLVFPPHGRMLLIVLVYQMPDLGACLK